MMVALTPAICIITETQRLGQASMGAFNRILMAREAAAAACLCFVTNVLAAAPQHGAAGWQDSHRISWATKGQLRAVRKANPQYMIHEEVNEVNDAYERAKLIL